MKSGYESITWIRDNDGKEFACYLDDIKKEIRKDGSLSPELRKKCLDVNEIIGTERW